MSAGRSGASRTVSSRRSWADVLGGRWRLRTYLLIGASTGVAVGLWNGLRGDWGRGLTLMVGLTLFVGPMAYAESRMYARATEAGLRWRHRHPETAERLPWIVVPLLLAVAVAMVVLLVR